MKKRTKNLAEQYADQLEELEHKPAPAEGIAGLTTSESREAQKKRKQRDHWRGEGFVWFQYWVHKDDLARAKKYLGRLKAARVAEDDE